MDIAFTFVAPVRCTDDQRPTRRSTYASPRIPKGIDLRENLTVNGQFGFRLWQSTSEVRMITGANLAALTRTYPLALPPKLFARIAAISGVVSVEELRPTSVTLIIRRDSDDESCGILQQLRAVLEQYLADIKRLNRPLGVEFKTTRPPKFPCEAVPWAYAS